MSSIIKYSQVLEGDKIWINHNITEQDFGNFGAIETVENEQEEVVEDEYVEGQYTEELYDEKISTIEGVDVLSKANEEAEALLAQTLNQVELQKQEAQRFCAKLIKDQEDWVAKKQEEYIKEQHHLQEEIETKRQEIEQEKEDILKLAYKEKEQIIKSAEQDVLQMVNKLTEIVVGECMINTDWIRAITKKFVLSETVEFPINLYIADTYTEEEKENLKKQFKESIGDVEIQTKFNLSRYKIEIETKLGSMEYDVSKGCETVLRQLSILVK